MSVPERTDLTLRPQLRQAKTTYSVREKTKQYETPDEPLARALLADIEKQVRLAWATGWLGRYSGPCGGPGSAFAYFLALHYGSTLRRYDVQPRGVTDWGWCLGHGSGDHRRRPRSPCVFQTAVLVCKSTARSASNL